MTDPFSRLYVLIHVDRIDVEAIRAVLAEEDCRPDTVHWKVIPEYLDSVRARLPAPSDPDVLRILVDFAKKAKDKWWDHFAVGAAIECDLDSLQVFLDAGAEPWHVYQFIVKEMMSTKDPKEFFALKRVREFLLRSGVEHSEYANERKETERVLTEQHNFPTEIADMVGQYLYKYPE